MKKIFKSFLCTLGALAVFSCAVDELTAPSPIEVPDGYTLQKFTAQVDATKTEVSDGHTVWSTGDQIKLFWDGGDGVATLDGEGGSATGAFLGAVPEGKTVTCAVYPADVEAVVDGSNVSVTFPAEQAGSFAAGNIAVSKVGEGNMLSFYNLNSFIAVQLISDNITKIEVESVAGGALVGTLPVNIAGDEPVFGDLESPAASVSMTGGVAGVYYISVLPGMAHDGGLLLKYYQGDEVSGTYLLDKELTTQRSHILQLGEFEPEGKYYVTVDGAGRHTGLSWTDAFSSAEMFALLTPGENPSAADSLARAVAIDGATFYMAAGTYDFGDNPRIDFTEANRVTLTLEGGYNASTGVRDLENNATIITGARDDNADPVTGHICLKLRGNMNVLLDGLHFENGLSSEDKGGALNCAGEELYVTLIDCVISNNKNIVDGADKNGAGLYLNTVGGGVRATRVTISNNTSLHAPALYVYNSDITMNDCVIEDNYASSWGGAARIRVGDHQCVFNNCIFNENSSNGDSGCVVFGETTNPQHAGSTLIFNGCTFSKNTCTGNGGAITLNEDVTCNIKGGTFSENAAKLGGAIFTPNNTNVNTISISDNCVFSKNYAIEGGWAGGIHFKSAGTLTVTDCTFSENYSVNGDSGAFNADNANATFTFTRVAFSGNHADGDAGGVMWISKGTYKFTDCTFSENYTSASGGGAVYANDTGTYSFTGCSFLGNYTSKKDKLGGAVYMKLSSENTTPMTFTDCTFDGNNATEGYGGTIALDGLGTVNIKGGSFKNGFARHGGAILIKNNGNLIIERNASSQGTLFSGNHANNGTNESYGGAIASESKNAEFSCTGATFRENYLDYVGDKAGYGGAIAIRNENGLHANIIECVFEGNYTACNGGSALSYQSTGGDGNGDGTGYMRVIDSRFEGNHVDYNGSNKPNETGRHGGAVRLGHDATPSYFDGCTFIGNYTETPKANRVGAYGGAINYYADGMCYLNNCYFENNRAARGGAISAKATPDSGLYLNGCSFSGNWNSYGGGSTIVLDRVKKFCMNNCSFNDNTYTSNSSSHSEQGSWIYADGDSAETDPKMKEVVISNCTAIGTCHIPNAGSEATAAVELFYFRRFVDGGQMHLINNCLINTNSNLHDAWWTNAVDLYGFYNVFNTAGRTGGNVYLDGNHNTGYYNDKSANPPTYNNRVLKEDLLPADIAWDATNHIWPWNGGLANSKIYEKLTATDYDGLMATASADFKAWLENVDPKGPAVKNVLHKDQLGTDRGTGDWQPGAYQAND